MVLDPLYASDRRCSLSVSAWHCPLLQSGLPWAPAPQNYSNPYVLLQVCAVWSSSFFPGLSCHKPEESGGLRGVVSMSPSGGGRDACWCGAGGSQGALDRSDDIDNLHHPAFLTMTVKRWMKTRPKRRIPAFFIERLLPLCRIGWTTASRLDKSAGEKQLFKKI